MPLEVKPRECLSRIAAYVPGKSIASVERELNLKRVVKLASNENPLGPSPKALREFKKSAAQMFLYPEGTSPNLRQAVARLHNWSAAGVIIGNGSDEIIRLACEAFLDSQDVAVLSQYAFLRFKQQALLMNAQLREVPMKDWTHDLKAMAAAAQNAKIVFIASPNNPTGTYNTETELREFLRQVPPATVIVLDEAYCHFAAAHSDYPSSIPNLVREYPNLLVLRTLSKAYGLAGLRLGYGVGHPELIGWLDRIRMPFNVNLPAQKAAIAALSDHEFVAKSVALAHREGKKLAQALSRCGFQAIGENVAANFLFVRSPMPGKDMFKALLKLGIIVRPLDEYGLTHHVRISIGNETQNRALIAAAKRVLRVKSGVLAA